MPARSPEELLSAYLAGELDDAEAAALEDRLGDDPMLAARLEALHDALVRLAGLDAVEPPAGYSQRLDARLAAEADAVASAAEDRAGAAVADLAGERARRRQVPWAPLGAVAAGVATLAVVVSVVGPPAGRDDVELAEADAPVAMDAPAEPDAGAHAFEDDETEVFDSATVEELHGQRDAVRGGAGTGAQAPAPAAAEAFTPVVVDSEVPLADEAAVRDRYAGLPEADGLLGIARDEAAGRADAARFAVQRSEAFGSGVHPAACLDVVSTATDTPVIVARVESAVYAGEPSLVYVAATVSSGSAEVDRVEAWVVAPDTCATRLFLTLAS